MYKKDKILCSLIFVSVLVLGHFISLEISNTLIQNLGTIFSILFGFYIAALSVIYGSAYSKKLYKKIDGNIPTQTQLHTLKKYFSASSALAMLALILIILTSLLADNSVQNGNIVVPRLPQFSWNLGDLTFGINCGRVWNSVVLGITSMNLYLSFRLLKVLLAGFVMEARPDRS